MIGPTLPPHLQQRQDGGEISRSPSPAQPGSDAASSSSKPAKSIAGPQLPPGLVSSRHDDDGERNEDGVKESTPPSHAPAALAIRDDDDDDGFSKSRSSTQEGKQQQQLGEGARRFLEREKRIREREERGETGPSTTETSRPDWMLAPPSSKSIAAQLTSDPKAALKARGFSQASNQRVQKGRAGGNTAGMSETDMALWTETPAEREQRMKEEELGIRKKGGDEDVGKDAETLEREERERRRRRERDEEISRQIKEHDAKRGASLLDLHRQNRRDELKKQRAAEAEGDDDDDDDRRRRPKSSRDDRSESGSTRDRERRKDKERRGDEDREERRRKRRREEEERERDRARDKEREKRRRRSRSRSRSASASDSEDSVERERRREKRRRRRKERERERERDKSKRRRSRSRSYTSSGSETDSEEEERRRRRRRERRKEKDKERSAGSAAKSSGKASTLPDLQGPSARERALAKAKAEAKKAEKPSAPMVWDHNAAMGAAGRIMDEGQRKKMLGSNAGALKDRFGSSSGGGRFL